MLTLFTVPKPFKGNIAVIQQNAIRSWMLLRPACEIILCGDEEGTTEIATGLGLRHVPGVARNEYGTPLLNSVFQAAQEAASYETMCYVNTDIMLMGDWLQAVRAVRKRSFLLIGQRWDIDLANAIDFSSPDWEGSLRSRIARDGKLHPKTGTDYFVFPKGLWRDIPPFAIGRTVYDNWLIYRARLSGVPVIDITGVATAVHQNHHYFNQPQGERWVWDGPEAKRNLELAGGYSHIFTIEDATHILTSAGLKSTFTRRSLRRHFDRLPVLHPWLAPIWKMWDWLRQRKGKAICAIWARFKDWR